MSAATTSKERALRLAGWAGLILGIGLAYALFVHLTGWGVPCPFHTVTGLWCPGCGVTRMCLSLLRLDLRGAWRANPGLLLLLPFLLALLASLAWRYGKTGRMALSRLQSAAVWAMVGLMLLYGVLRNLPWFPGLAPS